MTIRASSNFATLVFKQVLHSLPLTRQPYFEIIVHFLQFFDLPHRLRSSRHDREPEHNRTEYKLNLVVNSASNGATKQQAEQEQRQQHLHYVSDSGPDPDPDPAVRFYSVAACDPWHIVLAASLDFSSLCVCLSIGITASDAMPLRLHWLSDCRYHTRVVHPQTAMS